MATRSLPWWRGAVIYQVYPRSFADSNADGIGDLPGITHHLDHVASLGIDAVWLSPFFTSPMADFGYDVSDYRNVDPVFGTLAQFDVLIAQAHALGLKIIIDQVYSHSSNQHAWFQESRADRTNARADWYVWSDAKADGSPPNNWQSVFGGPAWTWDARRGQYYLHNFLSEQPQLNQHNPAVQDATLEIARFWLDRGVDGFRIDAINFAMHDPALTDNPPATDTGRRTRPFDYQQHRYNQSQPEIPLLLERVRAVIDSYDGDRFTVAEVAGPSPEAEMHAFTSGEKRLSSAYGFNFLYAPALTPALVRDALAEWPDAPGIGWPSWAFENHDAPRALSRWAAPEHHNAFARMKMTLLLCLRGNIFLYQGEELGLTQVEIAFEDLRDPEAIANWPLTLSRDGVRTPMPWRADAPHAGFSDARPWLPLGPDHAALAVDRQERDPLSLLHVTRRLIALRHANPALMTGNLTILEASDAILAFERATPEQRLLCVFNLSADVMDWNPATPRSWRTIDGVGQVDGWRLGGFAAVIAEWAG
ncbi:MAG: alpha-glucosidase [Pseudomonadota bacterium]